MISPQNQTTAEGVPAVFTCQYTNVTIIWLLNGEPVVGNNFHFPGDVRDGGNDTRTLTIIAAPVFSGAIVECLAFSVNERRYAILSVQG